MTNSKKQEPVQDAAIACAAGHSKTGDTDSTISLDMDGDATPPLLGNDRASGDDHVELEQGAGGYLVFTAACAVLSAFLFGWNIGGRPKLQSHLYSHDLHADALMLMPLPCYDYR